MRSLLKMIFLQTATRAVMYLEFDNFSYVMYIFTRHGHCLTRRARPDRIPVVCFEIIGLFDHEPPLKTLANRLDSDQARNFDKVSNCLKL